VILGQPIAAASIFALDQATKALVARHVAIGRSIGARVKIRRVEHVYVGRRRNWVLIFLGACLLGFICLIQRYSPLFRDPVARLGIGLALGGAASNLYDRMRHGTVIDFIDLNFWPIFDVADIAITAGAALALWYKG
jgi:signal peptidase II